MTKILPQEAAIIFAARNFVTACAELAIRELPEHIRYSFAALEAANKAYETLDEPSECVDDGDELDPGAITFDVSDLSGLEPGLHVVRMSEYTELPSGRVRAALTLVQEPGNVVQLEPATEPAARSTELDQAFAADMRRLVNNTNSAEGNTAVHMYRVGDSGRPIDTRITTHGITRLLDILDRLNG